MIADTTARTILVLVLLIPIYRQNACAASDTDDKALVMTVCTRCHTLIGYVTPRSHQAWQLTVARMRTYTYTDEQRFSDSEEYGIVGYLGMHFGEGSTITALEHFGEPGDPGVGVIVNSTPATPQEPAAPAVTATPPGSTATGAVVATVQTVSVRSTASMPAEMQERLRHRGPRVSAVLLKVAEFGGYLAVVALLVLVITGHSRLRLKQRFVPLHVAAALTLFLALASHGLIYLVRFGTPPVFWYWFGLGSFAVLVIAEFQGIIRKKFGRWFLRFHVAGGYAGLCLAVLHWIWAWWN
jgi:hypothetical protein